MPSPVGNIDRERLDHTRVHLGRQIHLDGSPLPQPAPHNHPMSGRGDRVVPALMVDIPARRRRLVVLLPREVFHSLVTHLGIPIAHLPSHLRHRRSGRDRIPCFGHGPGDRPPRGRARIPDPHPVVPPHIVMPCRQLLQRFGPYPNLWNTRIWIFPLCPVSVTARRGISCSVHRSIVGTGRG